MEIKLLHFWKRHPRAKLSLYSSGDILGNSNYELRNAVLSLAEKGVLAAQHNNNGLTTYTLSVETAYEQIAELARV
jgi:hypothetical protein